MSVTRYAASASASEMTEDPSFHGSRTPLNLNILKPYVERMPRVAASYRALRDIFDDGGFRPLRTPHGFEFSGYESMQDGTFEPNETAFISKALSSTDVFVDIGANIGFYSCSSFPFWRRRERHRQKGSLECVVTRALATAAPTPWKNAAMS